MLMHQGFTATMPAVHTKKNNTASSSLFTYTATLAWRPTQKLSTWERLVSGCVLMSVKCWQNVSWLFLEFFILSMDSHPSCLLVMAVILPLPSSPYPSPSSHFLVRPAKLPNLHSSDGKAFSWDYPDSWEKPCTFFGLQYQVKVVHSGHSCHSEQHIVMVIDITQLLHLLISGLTILLRL